MDPYETKLSSLLASSEFLARHPGNSELGSDIYSSVSNTTSELIQRQRYTGQYVSNANSLAFGAQSSFFISPGSVMNAIVLSGTVIVPRYTRAIDLWALNAIDSVELVISGSSSIQSLKINGRSHLEMILATLSSTKLEALKSANPFLDLISAGSTVPFSIPLHLFFSSAEITALFPLDTSALHSQIIVNIRWKQNYQIFSGDATNAVTLPSGFNTLYMRVMDQVNISNDFALANELRKDPNMVYSLPGTYAQSYTETKNITSLSTESQVNLTSMPTGQLQCILVSLSEVAREGLPSTQGLIHPFASFGSIRMLYNGVEVYRCDSRAEMALANAVCTDGDNGILHKWKGHNATTAGLTVVQYEANPVIVIPFTNEISKILRERRHEHSRDYSGSSLQFFFTVHPGILFYDDEFPISNDVELNTATGDFKVNFTFVNSSVYEVSQQTVSMNM